MDRRARHQRLLLQQLMLAVAVVGLGDQRAVAAIPPPGQPVRRRRRPAIPRVRLNPLGMTAQQVLTTYRLDMDTIYSLLREIEGDITPQIRIRTALPPLLKLLCVLHFCATGTFQNTSGLLHGISQPTFSIVLKQVMAAILQRAKDHIYMPRTSSEINAMKAAFYAIANFPQVIGCIDCTHIGVVPPAAHEEAYRNRKMSHSMNVQMVCDANMCFMEVCARFPGSAHDARILRASNLFDHMEQRMPARTLILGDSGYPLLPWLMTPVRNPQTPAEQRFNYSHIRTRNLIERSFGLLKSRFRCLDRTGGALIYKPEKVGKIVVVCAILHNIAIRRRVPLPEGADPQQLNDIGGRVNAPQADAREGRAARDALIRNFFG